MSVVGVAVNSVRFHVRVFNEMLAFLYEKLHKYIFQWPQDLHIGRNVQLFGVLLIWYLHVSKIYLQIWAGKVGFHTFPVQMWNKIP